MDRSLVGYGAKGLQRVRHNWVTKCACILAFTIKYDDRVLGFHFEYRGISAIDSFSFDFFWKFDFFKCCYAFFFLFKCLKETMVGETSYNRVFLGWLFRILSFIVILLWNYSCSPILSLSNLQWFQQNVCGIKAWNFCCDIFCKHQSCKQNYSQPKEVAPIWKAELTTLLWKRKYILWV